MPCLCFFLPLNYTFCPCLSLKTTTNCFSNCINYGIPMTLQVTHLSPFLSVMSVCRLAFMSRLRFSTMLLMQLSKARQRVWDWMACRQMGHSSFFLRHCLMQWQQKLWAQFRMTACINADQKVDFIHHRETWSCELQVFFPDSCS